MRMHQLVNQYSPITINKKIAQSIMETVKNTIRHNINIMNERGIVIASSDPKRVGTFHEIAFQIISGPNDVLEVDDGNHLIGTQKGINVVLKYKNIKVGVLASRAFPMKSAPLPAY